MLQIDHLCKEYRVGGQVIRAVDDVSLSVQVGEFVALVGKSGCGKTTLLLSAGALLRPDSGRVTVAGQDVYALGSGSRAAFRAANIGFVFQQFHLVPYLTVLQNVLCPSLATPIEHAQEKARALLEQMGLGHRLAHTPAQLSTGERQRVALARAVLPQPKLILADEPTGNLDDVSARMVIDALANFATGGKCVLIVTHDKEVAARAKRVVAMAELNKGQQLVSA